MLESFGNMGYQVGAVGIVAVTLIFLTAVRWWTDLLGRVLAGVLTTISLVLVMSTMRMMHVDLPGNFFIWRASVFWLFGVMVWTGLFTLVWAQFMAPRVKRSKMTTPQTRRNYEEGTVAGDRPSHDGDSYDRSGSER